MKIKIKNSAKRIFANVFSPKYEGQNPLIPENIKKDVSIFDITGTYDGGDVPPTPEFDADPFELDVTNIGYGLKIQFNTDKEEDLISYLRSIPSEEYFRYSAPLVDTDSHVFMLDAVRLEADGETIDGIMIVLDEEIPIPIFSTKTIDFQGISFVRGFQNLDADGCYSISAEISNSKVVEYLRDTTPPTWNGVLIGTKGSVEPVPSELIPFQSGDAITGVQFKDMSVQELKEFLDTFDIPTTKDGGNLIGMTNSFNGSEESDFIYFWKSNSDPDLYKMGISTFGWFWLSKPSEGSGEPQDAGWVPDWHAEYQGVIMDWSQQNRTFTISYPQEMTLTVVNTNNELNGVVFGKVE